MYKVKLLSFLSATFIFGCGDLAVEDRASSGRDFEFVIVDSIMLPFLSSSLFFGGYHLADDVFLFSDHSKGVRILEVDGRGEVKMDFECGGKGENKIGSWLSGLGYVDSKTIGVLSEKGLFFFDRRGNLLRFIDDPEPETRREELELYVAGGEMDKKIITVHRSYEQANMVATIGTEPFFKNFKHFTVYDESEGSSFLAIGFDDFSFFEKNDDLFFSHISFVHTLFEDVLYLINSPDPTVFIYDVHNDFKLVQRIRLFPEHFQFQDKKTAFIKGLYGSSSYTGIVTELPYTFITYRTGVPDDVMAGQAIDAELGMELYNQYNRNYVMIYENGKKTGSDILLPERVYTLLASLGSDRFLAQANQGRVENADKEVYYICRLREHSG